MSLKKLKSGFWHGAGMYYGNNIIAEEDGDIVNLLREDGSIAACVNKSLFLELRKETKKMAAKKKVVKKSAPKKTKKVKKSKKSTKSLPVVDVTLDDDYGYDNSL